MGSLAVRIEAPGYPVVVEQVEVVRDVVLYMQVMMPRADVILGELTTPPSGSARARPGLPPSSWPARSWT